MVAICRFISVSVFLSPQRVGAGVSLLYLCGVKVSSLVKTSLLKAPGRRENPTGLLEMMSCRLDKEAATQVTHSENKPSLRATSKQSTFTGAGMDSDVHLQQDSIINTLTFSCTPTIAAWNYQIFATVTILHTMLASDLCIYRYIDFFFFFLLVVVFQALKTLKVF